MNLQKKKMVIEMKNYKEKAWNNDLQKNKNKNRMRQKKKMQTVNVTQVDTFVGK